MGFQASLLAHRLHIQSHATIAELQTAIRHHGFNCHLTLPLIIALIEVGTIVQIGDKYQHPPGSVCVPSRSISAANSEKNGTLELLQKRLALIYVLAIITYHNRVEREL